MNSLVEDHEDCTDGSGICSNVAQSRLQYARWNLPTQLLGLIGWIILVVKHDSHLMLHKFGGSRPFLEDSLLVANIAVSSSWSTPPDLSIIIESRVGLVEEDAPKEIEVTGWTKQYKTTKHFTTITRHSARRRLPPPPSSSPRSHLCLTNELRWLAVSRCVKNWGSNNPQLWSTRNINPDGGPIHGWNEKLVQRALDPLANDGDWGGPRLGVQGHPSKFNVLQ